MDPFVSIGICILGLVIPVSWILRNWLTEHNLSANLATYGLGCHLTIFVLLYLNLRDNPYGLLIYSCFILLVIACNTPLRALKERWMLKQMYRDDMARYLLQIKLQPENTAAHAALAKLYTESGRYDEAIAEYEQAIDADPRHADKEWFALRDAIQAKQRLEEQPHLPGLRGRLQDVRERLRNR